MRELGKSRAAVYRKAKRLGLRFARRRIGGTQSGKVVKPWTRRDESVLEGMVGHHSISSMAERLGRTKSAIMNRLDRLGLDWRGRTMSLAAVAAILGVTPQTVRNYRERLGAPWGRRRRDRGLSPGASLEDACEVAQAILDNPVSMSRASVARLRAVASGDYWSRGTLDP